MHRIINFLRARSFAILLFHVGILLFNWPLLSMAAEGEETSIFAYLLIAWAVIVAILILMGQALNHTEKTEED